MPSVTIVQRVLPHYRVPLFAQIHAPACHAIRARIPDFEMIFVGDGPLQGMIEEAARRHPWIHYVGPRFGADRLPYFALAHLRHGENDLIVENSLPAYVDAMAAHLTEPTARQRLVEGCRQSAARYSVENTVTRYAAGIRDCLHVV